MLKKKKLIYSSLGFLFIAVILLWSAVFQQTPDNLLEVHFFDVGQGDSIFIETPSQRQILIDGGPDKTVLEKLNRAMSFYDRTIDLVILTHPDADHITGLVEVLEYYQVGHILTSGLKKDTAVYQRWRDLIEEKNIPLTLAQAGQRVVLGKDIILEILWPEQSLIKSMAKNANNGSVVGQLVYGQAEFLLTGDIEEEIEQYLVNHPPVEGLESDVLKVPHHGSKTSTSQNFIQAVNPQITIISVGQNNRYHHPHSTVLERLKDYLIYRTDKNGDIQIFTNGNFFNIITEYES